MTESLRTYAWGIINLFLSFSWYSIRWVANKGTTHGSTALDCDSGHTGRIRNSVHGMLPLVQHRVQGTEVRSYKD